MNKMFCYQCEQTANAKACVLSGVCGKSATTANLQDELTSKTIEFANCANFNQENIDLIIEALFTTIANVNFDDESIKQLTKKLIQKTPCNNNFDINSIWTCNEDIKSLKSLILFGLKGIAAYAYHANILGYRNEIIDRFFLEALKGISKDLSLDELLTLTLKTGEINLKCMELLDEANTKTYKHPIPTKVTTEIEAGPFIVVTGHDLKDLALLLEQTKDKGINIYTHGEMLPCHGYPELKKYPHLKTKQVQAP